MKKFLLVLGLIACMAMVSCNKCSKEETNLKSEQTGELVVENVVSMDKQDMFLNYKNDYRWYETCIVLKDYMDSEACDGTVTSVSNIFQYLDNVTEQSADVYVVLYTHTADTTAVEVKNAFWVGDSPMNDDTIKVTFKEAYDKMMQANCPKPHSKQVVLRKELGPLDVNPQYIFGNVKAQVYVDAVTGDVNTNNPAFPPELKMPLGEWP